MVSVTWSVVVFLLCCVIPCRQCWLWSLLIVSEQQLSLWTKTMSFSHTFEHLRNDCFPKPNKTQSSALFTAVFLLKVSIKALFQMIHDLLFSPFYCVYREMKLHVLLILAFWWRLILVDRYRNKGSYSNISQLFYLVTSSKTILYMELVRNFQML